MTDGPAPQHDPEDLADRRVARRMRVVLTFLVIGITVLYRFTGQTATADKIGTGVAIGLVLWWFGIGIVAERKKDK